MRDNDFKWKEDNFRYRYKDDIFYHECHETLEQAAQRSCGCFIAESAQSYIAQGFEQPGLVKDAPDNPNHSNDSAKEMEVYKGKILETLWK